MLQLKNISFSYTEKQFIKKLNLSIQKAEIISLIGESGCGKSTLLQIIYGLHHVEGKIFWNKKQLLGPEFNLVPGEEFIKYLSQDFGLMPSLSVAANIGKFLSNAYPRKKQRRIKELLQLVEMEEFSDIKAKNLSGGQQQRVALAKVLAKEPEILLLDEPFSQIDHFRRNKLRRELFSHLQEKKITCIIATHDSTDALSYAAETIVMKNGKIIAKGSPEKLYQHPKSAYLASLFGEINELPLNVLFPEQKSRKKIILYPHEITIVEEPGIKALVKKSFFRGNSFLIEAALGKRTILLENPSKVEPEQQIYIKVSPGIIKMRAEKG